MRIFVLFGVTHFKDDLLVLVSKKYPVQLQSLKAVVYCKRASIRWKVWLNYTFFGRCFTPDYFRSITVTPNWVNALGPSFYVLEADYLFVERELTDVSVVKLSLSSVSKVIDR